jgi:hypothetical protein
MRKLFFVAGTAGAAVATYRLMLKPWTESWGIEGDEAVRTLPGDDVLSDADTLETRGITIDAPPDAVWPWLVQMGYDRGGWYSYDIVDMRGRSADTILDEHQSLREGDVMPTDPAGGFEVRRLDPGRALVLGLDAETRRRQDAAAARSADATPANLQAAGAFLEVGTPPEFAVTWSFVLEPRPGGRTRLIERFRGRFGTGNAWTALTMPLVGFGVFVMVRRQLLGIRGRVEAAAMSAPQTSSAREERAPAGTGAEAR